MRPGKKALPVSIEVCALERTWVVNIVSFVNILKTINYT